jgi:hypothetical protein
MRTIQWSWALLERPLDVRPLDSFWAFHGTRRFNTEFTRALHLFLSLARPIQATSPHSTSPRSILILSTHLRLGLPSGPSPSGFAINNLYAFLFLQFVLHTHLSHPPRLDYSNYTWRRVQITKPLVMQFPPLRTREAYTWKAKSGYGVKFPWIYKEHYMNIRWNTFVIFLLTHSLSLQTVCGTSKTWLFFWHALFYGKSGNKSKAVPVTGRGGL